jgi:hypothetical protein
MPRNTALTAFGSGFRLESDFSRLVSQQEAASLSIIYAGSAGRAELLELKLMTLRIDVAEPWTR